MDRVHLQIKQWTKWLTSNIIWQAKKAQLIPWDPAAASEFFPHWSNPTKAMLHERRKPATFATQLQLYQHFWLPPFFLEKKLQTAEKKRFCQNMLIDSTYTTGQQLQTNTANCFHVVDPPNFHFLLNIGTETLCWSIIVPGVSSGLFIELLNYHKDCPNIWVATSTVDLVITPDTCFRC